MAWDSAGNIYVSDGYGNSRVAKFDKNGKFIKSWGSTGAEPGQFNALHGIALDAQGNVYVADTGNKRIQVFDGDGNFKTQNHERRDALARSASRPAPTSTSTAQIPIPRKTSIDGEIYKMELNGKIVGSSAGPGS